MSLELISAKQKLKGLLDSYTLTLYVLFTTRNGTAYLTLLFTDYAIHEASKNVCF